MFKGGGGTQGDLNGFLDAGSHMHGELRFEDTFRIDGKLTGTVTSDGDLIVGERGEVEGEVHVGRIFVSGTVRGLLKASVRVEVTSMGKVFADLFTPSLMIEDGAFLEGKCSMGRREQIPEAELDRPRPQKVARIPLAKG